MYVSILLLCVQRQSIFFFTSSNLEVGMGFPSLKYNQVAVAYKSRVYSTQ